MNLSVVAAFVAMPWAAAPAYANCSPAAANGVTVTCSGVDVTGVGNGSQNNVTVNVLQGASITLGNNASAINLSAANGITNAGAIAVGGTAVGIRVTGDNNTISSSGTIALGASSGGIFAVGNSNTVVNSGAITSSANSVNGMSLLGTGSTATNAGTIVLTGFGDGMDAFGANTLVNSGTIKVGSNSSSGIGMALNSGATGTNNGTVIAGPSGSGVYLGDNNSFTNNGTISGGQTGFTLFGSNNTFVNNGTVRGTDAAGASFGSLGTNGDTVTNNGTLDGAVFLQFGANNLLVNNGLITITNPLTPVGSFNHIFNGTFTQTAGGTLALRVTAPGAADTFAAPSMNLGGTLGAVVQPGLYVASTKYTGVVVATSPINGSFAHTVAFAAGTTTPLAFFSVTPTYNATTVDITLNRVGFGPASGETANESAVGNALEQIYATSLTGNAVTFFTNLLQASSVQVLDQLSGEGTAGTQNTAFLAGSLFMNTLMDQAMTWRSSERAGAVASSAPLGYAAEPRGAGAFAAVLKAPAYMPAWHAWGAGFGGTQSLKGDAAAGSADFSDRLAGGALGFDYQANPDLLIGLGVGGGHSSFSVDGRATSGTLDGGHVGAYGMQRFGSAYLSALVSYSWFDNSTTRTIMGVGPTETATGAFSSNQIGGRLELGNTYAFNGIGVTPFVAAQLSQLWQSGYAESSVTTAGAPGMLGLTYQPVSVWSLPTFLGAQLDTRVTFANGTVWSPYARASWMHEFNPTRQVSAFISALPAATFTVDGARAASNSAKVDLGSRLAVSRNIVLTANFSSELSDRGHTYAGSGGLRVSW
ncbi:MAG TPA: autotransporter domain-containing protein [Xanthobacteraceae bacterium]